MPYTDISQLPDYVKKYSETKQKQFLHVFNTIYNNTKNEARAFKGANSILSKRFNNKKDIEKNNSHNENFNHAINVWLKNV